MTSGLLDLESSSYELEAYSCGYNHTNTQLSSFHALKPKYWLLTNNVMKRIFTSRKQKHPFYVRVIVDKLWKIKMPRNYYPRLRWRNWHERDHLNVHEINWNRLHYTAKVFWYSCVMLRVCTSQRDKFGLFFQFGLYDLK